MGQAAFGRCATQADDGQNYDGDCDDVAVGGDPSIPDRPLGHSVQCCPTTGKIDDDHCGWIYARHGSQVDCPGYTVVAGFCGTVAYDTCQKDKTFGIRCCPMAI